MVVVVVVLLLVVVVVRAALAVVEAATGGGRRVRASCAVPVIRPWPRFESPGALASTHFGQHRTLGILEQRHLTCEDVPYRVWLSSCSLRLTAEWFPAPQGPHPTPYPLGPVRNCAVLCWAMLCCSFSGDGPMPYPARQAKCHALP